MSRMTWEIVGDSQHRGLGPGGCPKGLSMDACEDTPRTNTSLERERAGLGVHDLLGRDATWAGTPAGVRIHG